MEAEVVRIVANLFNGSPESAGTVRIYARTKTIDNKMNFPNI
jgi:hypothetical protein